MHPLLRLVRGSYRAMALVTVMAACSGAPSSEYPEVRLNSARLAALVADERTGPISPMKPPRVLERDEKETYAEVFPKDAVLSHLEQRLARLQSTTGSTAVVFHVSVERADATLFSHYTDEFVRYDVTLHVEVRTESGQLLNRGTTSAWRQIPKETATDELRTKTHVEAAVAAFDQYFADEDRLGAINQSLAAAEKSR